MFKQALCLDLTRTVLNPFKNHNDGTCIYHFLVWVMSAFPPVVAQASGVDGSSTLGYCWILPSVPATDHFKLICVYIPCLLSLVLCVGMMGYTHCKLSSGLHLSMDERSKVQRHGRFYVTIFCLYWIILGAFYFGAWYYIKQPGEDRGAEKVMKHFFPAGIAGHGLLLFVAWSFINRIPRRILRSMGCSEDPALSATSTGEEPIGLEHQMKRTSTAPWVREENKIDRDIVNSLRMEFVYLTAGGIRQSAARFGDIMWNRYHTEPRGSTHWPTGLPVDQTEVSLGSSLPTAFSSASEAEGEALMNSQAADTALEGYCMQQCDFYDYAPALFHQVRQSMGIQAMEYCQSFRDYEDGAAGMKERFSEGKSGSFMYFTFDRRYIVKTIPPCEVDCMMEILPEYAAHVAASNGSLLHYYGCHSIRLPKRRARVYFIVMKNFLQDPQVPRVRSIMRSTFDLKGCFFLRTAEEGSGTLQDNDWLAVVDDFTVRNMCEEQQRQSVQAWIARDAAFLSQMGVIDYSLLVGIADVTTRDSLASSYGSQRGSGYSTPGQRNSGMQQNGEMSLPWSPGPQGSKSHVVYGEEHVLYFGIIDILQKYDCKWTLQRIVLSACLWLTCKDPDSITAVPPNTYASRFAQFMEEKVLQVDMAHLSHANLSPALFTPLGRMAQASSAASEPLLSPGAASGSGTAGPPV